MDPRVVSQEEWNREQLKHVERELALHKQALEVAEARRALPWVKIDKLYMFDGPNGRESLADLFQGRRQLIMQHFMFAPEWNEGCSGCSVQADTVDGARYHFEPKDVSFVAVSRAPVAKLEEFKKRMGWKFKWVSSGESDFNYDFDVSFTKAQRENGTARFGFKPAKPGMSDLPAISVFYKNENGEIFRTFSSYEGGDALLPIYGYLDLTPIGRNEKSYFDWIKHHDKY